MSEREDRLHKDQADHGDVTIMVNESPVIMSEHRVTGLQVKRAAIGQGVEIQEDFHLVLEAHEGQDARAIPDDETITINKHSVFTANDGDDDS
jgi:hypothetical protein